MMKSIETPTDRAAAGEPRSVDAGSGRIRLTLALLAALGILASFNTPATAQVQIREDNFDRVGGDYRSFDLNPPAPMTFGGPEDVCRETCQRDGNCKAWTFVRVGVQGPKARCWLKNVIPAGHASNCCVSGVPTRPFEPGVDRPGRDYKNFDLASGDANLCKSACEREGQCVTWTFVKAGIQGAKARCWLKNATPPAFTNSCCVSGVREPIIH